jgi:hypothetical protein
MECGRNVSFAMLKKVWSGLLFFFFLFLSDKRTETGSYWVLPGSLTAEVGHGGSDLLAQGGRLLDMASSC